LIDCSKIFKKRRYVMKKSVKNVLATLSVSSLIAGSSLPLMAADKAADKPADQAEVKAAVKPAAAAKIKNPKGNPSCKVVRKADQIKENKAGKKCAGMKPAEKAAESK
jgi:hypothetical protein